jgi:hypothetical protein
MAKSTYRTLRGSITGSGNLKRTLLLDDGLINQGYRITGFFVWCGELVDVNCKATLSSKPKVAGTAQDASINTEIAWSTASQEMVTGTGRNTVSRDDIIDLDHVINRDLFITITASSESVTWNYLISMEARNLSDDEAILAIIREEAQNVGA